MPIYYSLGNFLFTNSNTKDGWYTGLVLEVNIEGDKLNTNVHPVRQKKIDFKLGLLSGDEKKCLR